MSYINMILTIDFINYSRTIYSAITLREEKEERKREMGKKKGRQRKKKERKKNRKKARKKERIKYIMVNESTKGNPLTNSKY